MSDQDKINDIKNKISFLKNIISDLKQTKSNMKQSKTDVQNNLNKVKSIAREYNYDFVNPNLENIQKIKKEIVSKDKLDKKSWEQISKQMGRIKFPNSDSNEYIERSKNIISKEIKKSEEKPVKKELPTKKSTKEPIKKIPSKISKEIKKSEEKPVKKELPTKKSTKEPIKKIPSKISKEIKKSEEKPIKKELQKIPSKKSPEQKVNRFNTGKQAEDNNDVDDDEESSDDENDIVEDNNDVDDDEESSENNNNTEEHSELNDDENDIAENNNNVEDNVESDDTEEYNVSNDNDTEDLVNSLNNNKINKPNEITDLENFIEEIRILKKSECEKCKFTKSNFKTELKNGLDFYKDLLLKFNDIINQLDKFNSPDFKKWKNDELYNIEYLRFGKTSNSKEYYYTSGDIESLEFIKDAIPATIKDIEELLRILQNGNLEKIVVKDTVVKDTDEYIYLIPNFQKNLVNDKNQYSTALADLENIVRKILLDKNNSDQKGGADSDDIKEILDDVIVIELELASEEMMKKLIEELEELEIKQAQKEKIEQEQAQKLKQSTSSKIKHKVKDYTEPLLSLIFYKIGNLNTFDVKLIEMCVASGLNNQIIVAILLAQKKTDIDAILNNQKIRAPGLFLNIIRLKKMSAEFKFKHDYEIHNNAQMSILIEKQKIW